LDFHIRCPTSLAIPLSEFENFRLSAADGKALPQVVEEEVSDHPPSLGRNCVFRTVLTSASLMKPWSQDLKLPKDQLSRYQLSVSDIKIFPAPSLTKVRAMWFRLVSSYDLLTVDRPRANNTPAIIRDIAPRVCPCSITKRPTFLNITCSRALSD
jgi:hypothetical protein